MTSNYQNYLLDNMNYNFVFEPPYNNDPLTVSTWARSRKIQNLTGISLIKLNVKSEANRLHVNDKLIIDLSVKHIWSFRLTSSQKDRFTTLANDANKINQNIIQVDADTLNRIYRLDLSQTVNSDSCDSFQNNFYYGVEFNDNDKSFQSLILPAGSVIGAGCSFP